jgi:DNA invertase Pin-like site-specific DNA recombinase
LTLTDVLAGDTLRMYAPGFRAAIRLPHGRPVQVVGLLDDLQVMGVGIVSLREGLDWTTRSGRLQAQLLAMIAEFERARLRERVLAGLARARREGRRLGRPPRHVNARDLVHVAGMSVRAAARELNVSPSVLQRARHVAAGEAQSG